MESFFATLKKELLYRIPRYRVYMDDVKSAIFKYVFAYYNQVRVYTSNPGGLPSAAYRRSLMEKQFAKSVPFANPTDYIIRISWEDVSVFSAKG